MKKFKIVWYEYYDDEVISTIQFNTFSDAKEYTESCVFEETVDKFTDDGDIITVIEYRYYDPELKETFFGFRIDEI